ncbi:MAG: acyl-CoA dehydrogenase [Candidatus Nanopelagicales bacterium]
MKSLLLSRRDIDFLLYEWLDTQSLPSRTRFTEHSRETFDAVLDLSAQMATEHFAPHNKTNDTNEPTFDGHRVTVNPEVGIALEHYCRAGMIGATMDEDQGGMQLPVSVAMASTAWFAAANPGTIGYAALTTANANLLLAHGDDDQIATWVEPMIEGRFFGTMCLSEPQAGSSLADLTTRAEPQADGTYRLVGNKMWISGGDQEISENIVHLVLARIPGSPPGVKGISLFIVPKYLLNDDATIGERNDVALAGLNHKMGYRGTTNCLLNFGEGTYPVDGRAGAVGYVVGEPNRGLSYMFHMMNEIRIGVGVGASALGYTGFLHSLDYARNRPQGRPLVDRDPTSAQIPIVEHTDVKRMLLAQKAYAEGGLALGLFCGRLVDEEQTALDEDDRARARQLLDVLTPVAKSWPSQWGLEANNLAIQVLGGYGYTREYPVEQMYRDNRLNPIHEGTHGIQALDLLGRKLVINSGAGMLALAEAMAETIGKAREDNGEAAEFADALAASSTHLQQAAAAAWASGNPAVALANASIYLEAFGHVVVAWLWLQQLLATGAAQGDFYAGKRAACRYFFGYELPKTVAALDLVASCERTTVDVDSATLGE